MTANDVIVEAQKVYLNDASGTLYTSASLLPFLTAAYDELHEEIEGASASNLKEVSSAISVTALATTLTLPSDFVKPIKLEERAVGGADDSWIPMEEMDFEPTTLQDSTLRYWVYREDEIKFVGATVNRQVKLYYWKSLTAITATSTAIPVIGSKRFLALRMAALAATYIGQNPVLGDRLDTKAQLALEKFKSNQAKNRQGMPVRRKPYGFRTRKTYVVSS